MASNLSLQKVMGLFVMCLCLALMLAPGTLEAGKKNKKNRNGGGSSSRGGGMPDHPNDDPDVVAARQEYERLSSEAAAARQVVARKRAELSRIHKRARLQSRGSHYSVRFQKSADMMDAEGNLRRAKENLSQTLHTLHQKVDDYRLIELKQEIQAVTSLLEGEKIREKVDGKAIIHLSSRLKRLNTTLQVHEKQLFALEPSYQRAVKAMEASQSKLAWLKKAAVEARQSNTPQQAPAENPEQISAKEEIAVAVAAYSEAFKAQQMAKKDLQRKLSSATNRYNMYLEEEARRRNDQRNNSGGKNNNRY